MKLLLALIFFVSASQALSGAGAGRHAGIRAAGKENKVMGNLPPREHMKRRGDSKATDWKKRSNNNLNRLRMEKKRRPQAAAQGAVPALGLTVRMVGKTDNEIDSNDGHLHKRDASKAKLGPEDGRNHKRAKSSKRPSYDGRNHKRRMSVPVDSVRRHRTLFEPKAKRHGKRHYGKNESSLNQTSSSSDDSESRNNMPDQDNSYPSAGQQNVSADSSETNTVTAAEATPTVTSETASPSVLDTPEESSSSSTSYTQAQAKETPSSKNQGSYGSNNTPSYGSSSGSGSNSGNSGSGSSSGSSSGSDSGYGSSSSGDSSDTSSYSGSGSSSGDVSSGSSDSSSGGSGSYSSTGSSSTADDDDEDCEDDDDDTAGDDDDDEDCDDSEDTDTTTTSSNSSSGTSDSTTSDSTSDTTSSSASGSSSSGMTYSGDGTYYLQNGNAGSCGNKASDSDMVVAIKTSIYSAGAKCGDKVQLTNTATGATASAIVADTCPTCNGDGIDLSEGLFKALSGNNLGLGVLPLKYVISS